MRVAVTGGTGFIGWHTARALTAAGHQVRALVRDAEKGARLLEPIGIGSQDRITGDMADPDAVARLLDGLGPDDGVVHAAAAVSVTDPSLGAAAFAANERGVECVIGQAHDGGVGAIVYVSSSIVLFTPGKPTVDTSPVAPARTHYSRSKAASEAFVRARMDAGAPIAAVYPTGVVGPEDPGASESVKAYRGFLRTTLQTSGGTQFVDVRDLAKLLVAALEQRATGRVLAGGHYFLWDEFTDLIEEVSGRRPGRMRAPGFALRAAGRVFDLVASVSGRRFPISGEGMEIATRMRPATDSAALAKLGIRWRDAHDTLADLYLDLHHKGRVRAEAIPRLVRASAAD